MAKAPSPLRTLRWWIEYAAVRGFAALLALLPYRAGLALGRSLGRLIYRVDRRHRRVALDNLALAWPDTDRSWRLDVARRAFEHLGRLLVEILLQGREQVGVASRLTVEGWEHLHAAADTGRGYFLLSGHFGNWEWIALNQAASGFPLWMIARPLDNPLLERHFAGLRAATGNRVVYKRNAVREMVKGLKAGQGIAFMIDQAYPQAGALLPRFFGVAAPTTPALGTLAARMDVPVVPVFAFPAGDDRYRVVYQEPIAPPRSGDLERDAAWITAEATRRVEDAIREAPGAWFWMHRRWREVSSTGEDRSEHPRPSRDAARAG